MFSLYKLILKTNLKSPSIIFPFIMPLIFLLMFAGGTETNSEVNAAVVSIISVSVMQSGLMGFGFNFMALKKSVLLKRIGATKITKPKAMMGIALYALTLFVISFSWTLILTAIFSASHFFGPNGGNEFIWNDVAWGSMFVGIVIGLFLSYAIGMMFLSFSKDDQQYSMMVMFYFFLASFLGGMLIQQSAEIEWMVDVGYAIPNVYSSNFITATGHGASIADVFNFSSGFSYDVVKPNGELEMISVEGWKAALNVFVPILFGIFAIFVSIKFFKWD